MTLNAADRRRITLATLVSMVALPALWFMQKDDSAPGNAAVAVAAVDGGLPAPADTEAPSAPESSPGPADPAFLGAPDATLPAPTDVLAVNVPPLEVSNVIPAIADYRRFGEPGMQRACATPLAQLGAEVTVRNVDNGRTATCHNVSIAPLNGEILIVLHTDVFLELADLIDAPLPVELSW